MKLRICTLQLILKTWIYKYQILIWCYTDETVNFTKVQKIAIQWIELSGLHTMDPWNLESETIIVLRGYVTGLYTFIWKYIIANKLTLIGFKFIAHTI